MAATTSFWATTGTTSSPAWRASTRSTVQAATTSSMVGLAMVGGTGNDTYAVDSLSDIIMENSGEGTDTAIVLVSNYILAANVENGNVGLANGQALTGNGLANTLTGNSGADV